jgi:NADH-quinone oxidoreductase subunit L
MPSPRRRFAPLAGAIARRTVRAGSSAAPAPTSVTILGVPSRVAARSLVFAGCPGRQTFNGTVYTWLVGREREDGGGLPRRPLTATMMVVVTFVSLMVHIYTIGYMADDPGYQRFFSYISLFTFSMLMLVMSNNFLQLFFGWEAVGLVSYLLIGFWYTRPTAIYANLKAFLVNRVGDFGFLLGIGLVLAAFGTLDYATVFAGRSPLAGTVTIELWATTSGPSSPSSASCCSSARWASPRSSRCTCGCPIRWKAPRRSPR